MCSCFLLQWGSHTEKRTAKARRQKLGFHLAFQGVNLLPTWMGRVSFQKRGTLLPLHVALVHCPSLSCKSKSVSMNLIVFWSTSCMYWHMGIICNTYITCGTGCHKTLSLNLFWRFSHYKLKPKILRFFHLSETAQCLLSGEKKFNHTSNELI